MSFENLTTLCGFGVAKLSYVAIFLKTLTRYLFLVEEWIYCVFIVHCLVEDGVMRDWCTVQLILLLRFPTCVIWYQGKAALPKLYTSTGLVYLLLVLSLRHFNILRNYIRMNNGQHWSFGDQPHGVTSRIRAWSLCNACSIALEHETKRFTVATGLQAQGVTIHSPFFAHHGPGARQIGLCKDKGLHILSFGEFRVKK